MNNPRPDTTNKPHSIWPGLVTLAVLLAVVAWSVWSGERDLESVLAFVPIIGVVASAAILSALLAARIRDGSRVVLVTRVLCPLLVAGVGVAGYGVVAWWGLVEASAEAFWCILGIFAVVGTTLAPFVSAYAIYRHARRSGKSHEEAQAISRWDPDKFGLK